MFPLIGIVPMLAPVERTEDLLERRTVRRNHGGRLSSRHFRNQLWLLTDDECRQYLDLVAGSTPEIELRPVVSRFAPKGLQLDLFYEEPGHQGAQRDMLGRRWDAGMVASSSSSLSAPGCRHDRA